MPISQPHFPVLSIVGTTAVGKTAAAFDIAHALLLEDGIDGVDIISADSKQVFQDLEVLTGADIPSEFSRVHDTLVSDQDFFEFGKIRLFGISMLEPTQEWSVAQFQQYALDVIRNSHELQRSVIIVGGTGLFHKHLFNPDPRLQIQPNQEIREKAAKMSVEELQAWLEKIDQPFLAQMNQSDRQNPRRLVRAIEVAQAQLDQAGVPKSVKPLQFQVQHFYLGLSAPFEILEEKITTRLQARFTAALEEVADVTTELGDTLSPMARAILGFPQLEKHIFEEISETKCQELWLLAEKQYAKRQLTWWKSHQEVTWFDTTDSDQKTAMIEHGVSVLRHGVHVLACSNN